MSTGRRIRDRRARSRAEPEVDRDPPVLRGRQLAGHDRRDRPAGPRRQPPPRSRPVRGHDQGPAPVPRGDGRALRRRRQRLPLRPQGPDRVPGLSADAAGIVEPRTPGRPSASISPGSCGTTRPPSSSSTRSSRSTPTRSCSRSSARTRGPTPSSASTSTPSSPPAVADLRHDQHRLQPGPVPGAPADAELPRDPAQHRPGGGEVRHDRGGRGPREADPRARFVAPGVPPGPVLGRPAARAVRPGPHRPVQRPPAPPDARRPQGPAAGLADRAGPRRSPEAGPGALERGDPGDGRPLLRARGRGSSGSGAVAGCRSCSGSCRSPRRSRSTSSAAACRASGSSEAPGCR